MSVADWAEVIAIAMPAIVTLVVGVALRIDEHRRFTSAIASPRIPRAVARRR